ncbi:hypothetical protein MKX01_027284 [Papaver californicum]|nr:hypothetical protein MKX01_027284 [Papaver californicum]
MDFPQDVRKLIKLRHLIINVGGLFGFRNIPPMPEKISSLSSLTYLPVFVVGHKYLFGIEELGGLNLLGGKLKILHLKNVRDREEAEGGRLKEKSNILSLKLHWRDGESFSDVYKKRIALSDDSEVDDYYGHDFGVLEGLEPHQNLKRWGIYYYLGSTFPTWVMSLKNSLPNLVHIVLKNCKICEYLPPLGILPFLKVLRIEGFESVKSVGNEFYEEAPDFFPFPAANVDEEGTVIGDYFPSLWDLSVTGWSTVSLPDHIQHITSVQTLEICCFDSLVALPEWLGDYASLRELVISECKNLKYLPSKEQMQHLTSLQQLSVFKCQILEDRCKRGGEEFYKISHLPPVRF